MGEGEETVGDGQRQRHVAYDEVSRSEDNVLSGTYFSPRHSEVEVGVGGIAGGIASFSQEELAVGTSLCYLCGEESLLLLRVHLLDESFLRLEVEGHRVVLISVAAHLEHRRSLQHSSGVATARCMYERGVEAHVYLVALQVHVLVFHVAVAEEVGHTRGSLVDERVLGREHHRCIDAVLLLTVQGVESQRVVDHLIVFIDGQLERVHRGSVALQGGVGRTIDVDRGFDAVAEGLRSRAVSKDTVCENAVSRNAVGKNAVGGNDLGGDGVLGDSIGRQILRRGLQTIIRSALGRIVRG